jgi:hypothetical protein
VSFTVAARTLLQTRLCPLPAARGEAAHDAIWRNPRQICEQLQPSRLRFDGRFDGRRFAFLAARTESD